MCRQRATVATPGEWQYKTARSGEWAQQFSNASCFSLGSRNSLPAEPCHYDISCQMSTIAVSGGYCRWRRTVTTASVELARHSVDSGGVTAPSSRPTAATRSTT